MKAKAKEKIDRMQRKVAKPLGRGERRPRALRSSNEADVAGSDKPRVQRDDQGGRKPRVNEGRSDKTRGTPVAERPGDARKGGKRNDGAGRPSGPGKRPAGDGQRPGFGRSKRA
jgi:23S rRNA pseudouridine2605 synthase